MGERRTAELAPAVPLRDGSSVLIRAVRASDKPLLRAAFERLGENSRYRRFLTPLRELTPSDLRYLTEVDHRDHEALIATDPATQAVVGVARYVRTADPDAAEVAVAVVDDWQGKGVGTALLERIAVRARQEGVARFTGLMLATNRDILDLMRRLGPAKVVRRDGATIQVETELAETAPASGLEPALRLCADQRSPRSRPAHWCRAGNDWEGCRGRVVGSDPLDAILDDAGLRRGERSVNRALGGDHPRATHLLLRQVAREP